MSATTIKVAIAQLLRVNFLNGNTYQGSSLQTVTTQYERYTASSRMPRAIVWDENAREELLAGGTINAGVRRNIVPIVIRLVGYSGQGQGGAESQGLVFDALVDAVLHLLRVPANVTLSGAADVPGYSKVLWQGLNGIQVTKYFPEERQQYLLYQADIRVDVWEDYDIDS